MERHKNLLAQDEHRAASARPRERADAARNRARILAAAEDLFAERDPREITMEDVARAAGVGRGTLYRRYPDIASIAVALLDEHERALQEKLLRGDPPLGPGADPGDRLAAFYEAMIGLLDRHVRLSLGAETGRSRFSTGAYGFWRAHVRMLLLQASVKSPDVLVDILLAPLAPEVFRHQRDDLGLSPGQIADALTSIARAVVARSD
ncbi:TetR/AcrR family transcriptional regulator [Streptomyces sp. FZ201]|uniref:TetR/AcrR family transcriptional regulator n=1 Tax=Streptomyces sp. FZ201 TaxID=3057122 RepID=UPI0021C0BFA1|nr:TetR/AcrR family transcriptional regulator [Streptomyces sp. FZ201]